jgi:hypothetical protein
MEGMMTVLMVLRRIGLMMLQRTRHQGLLVWRLMDNL